MLAATISFISLISFIFGDDSFLYESSNDTYDCFNSKCSAEQEACLSNNGCQFVAEFADVICKDVIECVDLRYATYVACDGDANCGSLVSAASTCYFKECSSDCLASNCSSLWTLCSENTQCGKSLQLVYNNICNGVNCSNSNVQYELCEENDECFNIFAPLQQCYQQFCVWTNLSGILSPNKSDEKRLSASVLQSNLAEISCIGDSGAKGNYDEYGNCCESLGKVDCLWNENDSMCGWYYINGSSYCDGIPNNMTCKEYLSTIPVTSTMTCNIESSCLVEMCSSELQNCGENDPCITGATILEQSNEYNSSSCQEDTTCISLLQSVYTCYKSNCTIEYPPTTTKSSSNTLQTTQAEVIQSSTTKKSLVDIDLNHLFGSGHRL